MANGYYLRKIKKALDEKLNKQGFSKNWNWDTSMAYYCQIDCDDCPIKRFCEKSSEVTRQLEERRKITPNTQRCEIASYIVAMEKL